MSKLKALFRYWWPAILMMVVIFSFSSIPSRELPNFGLVDLLVKKGGHALGYGLLGLAFLRGLKGDARIVMPRQLLLAWTMAVLYSATDEFHQSFVPGRHPAVTDVLIDAVGAATALFIYHQLVKKSDRFIQVGKDGSG